MLRSALAACALAVVMHAPVVAQSSLMSPVEFLGYELGARFTPHHRVVDYVRHVAEMSDRVVVEPYGETYEHRPLMVAYVSTPENLGRLDVLRDRHLQVVNGERSYEAGDPAIVYLAFNVHGNEASSTEAALKTLHTLASGQDSRADGWLSESIIIIDPLMNPDGRDRYVNWYRQTVGQAYNPTVLARERSEPWPGARTNHYYFDLNRDWAWMTQQETRHRIDLYNQWMPHIHVDFHEQSPDAPYYFAPAAEPFHEAITDWQRAFQTTIGRNHTRYFDANNWLYFTRQRFDLFYPGYGDTWPTFNGSIGMTYEQAGGGRAGLGIETSESDTLTLADRLDRHFTTALSTIETAVRHRSEMLQEFETYFDRARSGEHSAETYIIRRESSPQAVDALAALLQRQGIDVGLAGSEASVSATPYGGGRRQSIRLEPGDLVVSARQPKGVLVDVLFDARPALSDSITYDITAWSLPYVFGVEAHVTTDRVPARAYSTPAVTPVRGSDRPYAYLVDWQGLQSARFLADVLRHDVRLRFNTEPFEMDGRTWGRGTLILTRTGNTAMDDHFDSLIRDAARKAGVTAHGVSTGFVATGADFGSSDVAHLPPPRVAALSGPPTSSYALGEVWHFFDEQIEYPLTLIDHQTFDPERLSDVDVLILPGGSYGDLLTESRLSALKRWVERGGRLIAMEGAATFLAGKDGFALERPADADAADADSLERRLRRFGDREREAMTSSVSGSIYSVRLDASHPLAFGYGEGYYTMKRGTSAHPFLKDGWNVGVIRSDGPVAGFAGGEARQKLKDTLVIGQQRMGRGQVVYFVDSPIFRGFWHGGKLMFANAVFMAGAGN